jgi:hypothetical protein
MHPRVNSPAKAAPSAESVAAEAVAGTRKSNDAKNRVSPDGCHADDCSKPEGQANGGGDEAETACEAAQSTESAGRSSSTHKDVNGIAVRTVR